ncbi:MAG: NAD(P)H-hydrate epimerase [Pseudomonadota bacterium]
MTELLTAAQMRAIEAKAMAEGDVTGLALMERAGQGVVEAIFEEWPAYRDAPQSVSVLCGPGNNGGDGYVVARLLHGLGWQVAVYGMDHGEKTGADARANRAAWEVLGPVAQLEEGAFRAAPGTALYIDAIFGIGLSRPASGELARFIGYLAGSGGDYGYYQPRMVALDVPSGLCADSGRVLGCPEPDPFNSLAPYAHLTVTFEAPKAGHFLADGPALCGKLAVKSIGLTRARSERLPTGDGMPASGLRPPRLTLHPPLEVGPEEPHALFRPLLRRKYAGHKYEHGHVLALSGGVGRTGASRLAARAALRVGAGAVTLAAPPASLTEIAAQSTSVMCRSLRAATDLSEMLEDIRINTVCIGPGLGLGEREAALLEAALAAAPPPGAGTYVGQGRKLVLDADALTLLAARAEPFAGLGPHVVLTPHMGEFARLFPEEAARLSGAPRPAMRYAEQSMAALAAAREEGEAYRAHATAQTGPAYSKVDAVREAAAASGAIVLLKGADTVVANPAGEAWVHAASRERAAPWLATAGSGDVLSGIIAGLAARGHRPDDAAILAAALHVDCALAFGPGLIAEDLPEMLPRVLRDAEAQ